jgi:hypothetical protein
MDKNFTNLCYMKILYAPFKRTAVIPIALVFVLASGAQVNAKNHSNRTLHIEVGPNRIHVKNTRQFSVTGTITDEKNLPLPGVTVRVKNGAGYAITGNNGEFSIAVPNENAVLVFSYSGFLSQEVPVAKKKVLNIMMLEQNNKLNEVVVVGYGTQKRANLTGAVDQVGAEVFNDRPLTSTTKGLQGAIPNLNIRITDGKPTRGATYNVRGTTSIGAGGSALVLVDGVHSKCHGP